MVEAVQELGLAATLVGVAVNPTKVRALHTLLGDYCHQTRNLLNSLKLALYIARQGACPLEQSNDWDRLDSEYKVVEKCVERIQAICRPMPLATINASLSLVIQEQSERWTTWLEQSGRQLTLDAPKEPDVGDLDPIRLSGALDGFVEWRADATNCAEPIVLRWGKAEGDLYFEWIESGSLDAGEPEPEPAGMKALSLPLLARVVAAHRGRFQVQQDVGFHVAASWPATISSRA